MGSRCCICRVPLLRVSVGATDKGDYLLLCTAEFAGKPFRGRSSGVPNPFYRNISHPRPGFNSVGPVSSGSGIESMRHDDRVVRNPGCFVVVDVKNIGNETTTVGKQVSHRAGEVAISWK